MGTLWGSLLTGCAEPELPAPADALPKSDLTLPAATPAPVQRPEIVSIHVGESTTCVRTSEGRLSCAGDRSPLQTPLSLTEEPASIEVTDSAICLRSSGTPGRQRCLREGVDRTEPTGMIEVARGAGAAVGRDYDGLVWAFRGETEEGSSLVPVALPHPAVRVVSGGEQPCAWLQDKSLWCWDPYAAMTREPTAHTIATDVRAVDAGYLQTCWITETSALCRTSGAPRRIAGITRPTTITVGRVGGCVLQEGVPLCWSGRGKAAKPIDGVTGAVAIDSGDDHTCVIVQAPDRGKEVTCWGVDRGQLVAP